MRTCDVIIIGGGIIGLSTAHRLARDGLKVVVLERRQCGLEASWASAGIVSPCSWHRKDDLARMHMDAVFRYHHFAGELQEHSGIDVGFRRCGKFKPILDDNRMKMAVNEVKAVGQRVTPEGLPIVKTLSPSEARALEPNLADKILGAQHCRMTAQVRSPRLLHALRICSERCGAQIREGVTAQALLTSGTKVDGVRTDQGTLAGGATVLCGGAWSSQLDPALGDHMAVHPVRGQIVLLHVDALPFTRIIDLEERHFYMVPREDGHILVGSTEEHDAGFSKRTTAQAMARLAGLALEYVPALSCAALVRTWAGLRPGTPDRRPFIGPVPGLENLIAATGHFRTGLATAPVVADIVADLLKRGTCDYDLEKCAPGRRYPPQPVRRA